MPAFGLGTLNVLRLWVRRLYPLGPELADPPDLLERLPGEFNTPRCYLLWPQPCTCWPLPFLWMLPSPGWYSPVGGEESSAAGGWSPPRNGLPQAILKPTSPWQWEKDQGVNSGQELHSWAYFSTLLTPFTMLTAAMNGLQMRNALRHPRVTLVPYTHSIWSTSPQSTNEVTSTSSGPSGGPPGRWERLAPPFYRGTAETRGEAATWHGGSTAERIHNSWVLIQTSISHHLSRFSHCLSKGSWERHRALQNFQNSNTSPRGFTWGDVRLDRRLHSTGTQLILCLAWTAQWGTRQLNFCLPAESL